VIKAGTPLNLSGERLSVVYRVHANNETEAHSLADFIRVEQTIEYPFELVAPGEIRDELTGQIESISVENTSCYQVTISYAVETTGYDLPQTLNLIFGNISFVPNIQVRRVNFTENFLRNFKGPRFGREGIRKLLNVYDRPMVSTALKPIGLNSGQLAEMAYTCALGGIDIIKDDHSLSFQKFAPFHERTSQIVEAVKNANEKTGNRTIYFANISGPIEQMVEHAFYAKQVGIDGLMLLPGLYSLEFFRRLAEDDDLGLPMMFHPGFMGTYRIHPDSGISPFVLHGQLSRLCGADISIFPHYAGRFSPPVESSRLAMQGTGAPMHNLKANLPCPGGGVQAEFFKEMVTFYGKDAVFLAAGNLHRYAENLLDASRSFRQIIETVA
jgi:ribulose-bisphosphate carboxylase large chain